MAQTRSSSAGNDVYRGGDGIDQVSYWTDRAGSGVTVDLLRGTADGALGHETIDGIENVQGSIYNDTVRGDNATYTRTDGVEVGNLLMGEDGRDVIVGRGGPDQIDGGSGNDVVFPGVGDDFVFDDAGSFDKVSYRNAPGPVTVDLLNATATGEGDDAVFDMEVVTGSRFSDSLSAGNPFRTHGHVFVLWGMAGNDTLVGRNADDRLYGQGGADNMTGGAGTDRCDGGADTDTAAPDCETVVNVP